MGILLLGSSPDTADIFVLAGQSNAQVNSNTTLANVPAYIVSDAGIKIWDYTSAAFVTYGAGTNSLQPNPNPGGGIAGNWGPEADFSYQLRQASPSRPVYIVKYAIGSSTLYNNAGPCWDPAAVGSYFANVESAIGAAKSAISALGFTPRVRLIIWMQGEADEGGDGTMDAAYLTNLTAIVSAMRARWGDSATKINIGRIIPSWAVGLTGVRSAQVTIGSSNPGLNYWLNCDGFSQSGGHYDSVGTPQFGKDNFYLYTLGETQRVINGTFNTVVAPWVGGTSSGSGNVPNGSVATISSGSLLLTNAVGATASHVTQPLTGLTVGATYKVSANCTRADNSGRLWVVDDSAGLGNNLGGSGSAPLCDTNTIGISAVDKSFVATATTLYISLLNYSFNTSGSVGWDDVTVTGP